MAAHHALQGIRVNCICPGTVYTPMVASRGMTPELREARKMGTLLQVEGTPWDVAMAAAFLASARARWPAELSTSAAFLRMCYDHVVYHPTHVIIETFLCLFIAYVLLFKRAYDPKKRVGDDACPFTTLYWDFLDRHRETFARNHRMAQQVNGLNRLSDVPELRVRAQEVLTGLDAGLI
jgi:hypothetical protein